MLFGSTEKHYTASKTFQCLLSGRPLFSVLHNESSAVDVINQCGAADFLLPYKEGYNQADIISKLKPIVENYQKEVKWDINLEPLGKYTSKQSAKALTDAMDKVLSK